MTIALAQQQQDEIACLSAQLRSPELISADWLPPPDLYGIEGHSEIASALLACGTNADVDTLCAELYRSDALDIAGGLGYIEDALVAAPDISLPALKLAATRVIDRGRTRRLSVKLEMAQRELNRDAPRDEILANVRFDLESSLDLLNAPSARPRPLTLNLSSLTTTPPPGRTWFIRDWLGPFPTLFAASGGIGKSLLAQQTATALAVGRSFIGEVEQPLRSLMWACEDDIHELGRRQLDISRYFDIDPAAPGGNLVVQSRLGLDSMLVTPYQGVLQRTNVFEELRQQVNDLKADVLWLDNVAHLYGGDEIHRGQVTSFISALAGLVIGRPFAVVLLSHVARQSGSEYAGSAGWENAARMRWYLGNKLPDQRGDDLEEPSADVRYLAKRKANYAQKDYLRFRYCDGAFSADQSPGTALASHLDEKRAEELLVAAFRTLRTMGLQPTDGKSSPDFLPRQAVAKNLVHGYGQKEMSRALDRLMGRGEFIRGTVGQYSNRSPKQGLILTAEVSA